MTDITAQQDEPPKKLSVRAYLDCWEEQAEQHPAADWKYRFQVAMARLRAAEEALENEKGARQ